MNNIPGTIYMLHFDHPYKHAAHYTGWTADLDQRLAEHASGHGARLTEVIRDAGPSLLIGDPPETCRCGHYVGRHRFRQIRDVIEVCRDPDSWYTDDMRVFNTLADLYEKGNTQ